MKKTALSIIVLLFCYTAIQAQDKVNYPEENKKLMAEVTEYYQEIPQVTPGEQNLPPSDAIVLFGGKDLSAWQKANFGGGTGMLDAEPAIKNLKSTDSGKPADWAIDKGDMVVVKGTGAVATKQSFGDMQLHIEWLCPEMQGVSGQGYANSGVFLMGFYEVQVLNSYINKTYADGQAGSIYKQRMPLVNASRPPGSWQEYDIYFTAPRFSEKGTIIQPAQVTVVHNGVLVQYNTVIEGPTCYIGKSFYVKHADKLPLVLQDHGDAVRFRNIWVREL